MPELPEVEALVTFLRQRLIGDAFVEIVVRAFSALKTHSPQPDALRGLVIDDVSRRGKFVDIDASGVHLVIHFSRAGWLRWADRAPEALLRPGKGPIAARIRLASGSGFDLTEAGTQKRLAIYLTADPTTIEGIARLGPDPLAEDFDLARFTEILRGRRTQLKGVLRDQSLIAGIGNAYSDEILHVARLSPFAIAGDLVDPQITLLHSALRTVLEGARERAFGMAAKDLKDGKRVAMRVHGRSGEACPECGDVIRSVSFADSSLEYCATCQTGGKPLADRRMSRLLR